MAFIIKDRIKEGTTTTGTGDISLGGAAATFEPFGSYMVNGDTTYYAIVHTESGVDEWEVGLGTYDSANNAITRTTILSGSAGTSAVNFSAGTKDVFMTYPASHAALAYDDVTFDNISVTGTVDGRDVAADGAKLDTVETNADVTDAVNVAAAGALMKSGGTMTGDLILNGDPTVALGAATKEYVDTIAAAGIHYHTPVRVETPSALTATYDNGASGVGATLTNSGTQAALTIDGVIVALNDRVLVYKQTNAAHNGIYTVTDTGSASTNWVLTRAVDADSYGASDPDAMGEGDAYFVKEGDTGAGELYVMNTSGVITFGTTPITFTVIAETAVYSAGTGISLDGTTFSIGQDVATTANVTFNQVVATIIGNVTGNLTGNVTGNADTATALATARTIQLTGDVTGSATFDGTANAVITATVQDDSHAHVISNVDGLQAALDAKADDTTTITAGTGLTGGGSIGVNRTISLDTSYTDGRYVNVTGDTMTGDLNLEGWVYHNVAGQNFVLRSDTSTRNTFEWQQGTTRIWTLDLQADGDLNFVDAQGGNTLRVGDSRIFADNYHPNADKWTTARTLSLSGDASGSVSWDGSGNATLSVTVADNSHNHTYLLDGGTTTNLNTAWQALPANTDGGLYVGRYQNTASNKPYNGDNANWLLNVYSHAGSGGNYSYGRQFAGGNTESFYTRNVSNGSFGAWRKVWNDGNDGSGSGLDADLLQGVSGGSFARRDQSETFNGNITVNGDIYGKSVNGAYSSIYRMGGIYFTWDSDSYGTNIQHSIRSTNGDSYGDSITINSYGNIRMNIDSNNNGSNTFSIGSGTTGTGNTLLTLNESGNLTVTGDLLTDEIRARTGQDLTITAGESYTIKNDSTQNDEFIRLGAENGVIIYSSSNNLSSGLNRSTTLIDTAGDMIINNGSLNMNGGGVKFNDVSRYWLSTATNWGIYWDTGSNQIEFHGAGTSRFNFDLDDGYGYFAWADLSGGVKIGNEVVLQESTDRADLLQITSTTSGWGGLQIRNSSNEGRWSFMTDGETAGIYNDEDNQWHIYMTEAQGVSLYYAGAGKLSTQPGGVNVTGTLIASQISTGGNYVVQDVRLGSLSTKSYATDTGVHTWYYTDSGHVMTGYRALWAWSDDMIGGLAQRPIQKKVYSGTYGTAVWVDTIST